MPSLRNKRSGDGLPNARASMRWRDSPVDAERSSATPADTAMIASARR